MRFKRAFLKVIMVAAWLAVGGLFPDRLSAQDKEEAEYKDKISAAVREFDLQNWQEARALFKAAHQLKPNARTLRGMGMAAYEMRRYLWALRDLEAALQETRQPLTEEQRNAAKKLIEQSKAFIGRYRVMAEPPAATLEVDGKPAELDQGNVLMLEIGEHKLVARAPDYQELEQTVVVEGGEDQELRLMLEPVVAVPAAAPVPAPAAAQPAQPPPQPQPAPAAQPQKLDWPKKEKSSGPTWAWVTLGVCALSGLGAGGFKMIADKKYDDMKSDCNDESGCVVKTYDDSKKAINTLDKLTSIFLGVSITFAVASVVLFVVESTSGPEEKSAAKAKLEIGPAGLRLQGRF